MDEVFRALADPSRRQLLDRLNARGGQTLGELCAGLDMARQSVSKHLAVLEAANLVTVVWRGREKLHHLNAAPITDIADRWISRYDRHRLDALADLKRALEDPPMHRPEFVYTTYIRTTPERLWAALTRPEFTRRYWLGITFDTDWAVGSTITWVRGDVTVADPAQVVLHAEPYTRLSYTWHSYSPEFAGPGGHSAEFIAAAATESRSTVTFEIEPVGETCRLTVVHDGFDSGSVVLGSISNGWPLVLSRLKTLLETGEVD